MQRLPLRARLLEAGARPARGAQSAGPQSRVDGGRTRRIPSVREMWPLLLSGRLRRAACVSSITDNFSLSSAPRTTPTTRSPRLRSQGPAACCQTYPQQPLRLPCRPPSELASRALSPRREANGHLTHLLHHGLLRRLGRDRTCQCAPPKLNRLSVRTISRLPQPSLTSLLFQSAKPKMPTPRVRPSQLPSLLPSLSPPSLANCSLTG